MSLKGKIKSFYPISAKICLGSLFWIILAFAIDMILFFEPRTLSMIFVFLFFIFLIISVLISSISENPKNLVDIKQNYDNGLVGYYK